MNRPLHRLKENWEDLGRYDPLWAVVSHPDKRNNKWDLDAFLKTGAIAVARYTALLERHAHRRPPFDKVLDFGCGVGRLTRAWSPLTHHVVGMDVSCSMIEKARELNNDLPNVEFRINPSERLQDVNDNSFELVMSHICLQHMPWVLQQKYILEFARVCEQEGFVIFQLPSGSRWGFLHKIRKRAVDLLPFGLDRKYRMWRHGVPSAMDMYFTPSEKVERTAASAGLQLIHKETDGSAGPNTRGYIYIFRKSGSPTESRPALC